MTPTNPQPSRRFPVLRFLKRRFDGWLLRWCRIGCWDLGEADRRDQKTERDCYQGDLRVFCSRRHVRPPVDLDSPRTRRWSPCLVTNPALCGIRALSTLAGCPTVPFRAWRAGAFYHGDRS